MKADIRLFLFAMLIVVNLSAQNQGYHFELYTMKEGLCSNRLTSLWQDRDGFLWIGTEKGLSRFDGSLFDNYFPRSGDSTALSSESILFIREDSQGTLWIRTHNGINLYNPLGGCFRSFLTYPKHFQFLHEAGDFRHFVHEGKVCYIQADQQLSYIDYQSGKAGTIAIPSGSSVSSPPSIIGNILPRGKEAFWLARVEGLSLYKLPTQTLQQFEPDGASGWVQFLQDSPDGVFYAKWHHGLFFLDLHTGKTQNWKLANGEPLSNIINSILPISSEVWWVATEGGLYCLNPFTGQNDRIPLPNETDYPLVIKDLLKDIWDNIWVATEHGLLKLDPHVQGFSYRKVVFEAQPIYENQIYQVVDLPEKNKTFVLSRGGHLYVLDRDENTIVDIPVFRDENAEPTRLFQSQKSGWYMTSRSAVYHFDPETYALTPLSLLPRRENRKGLFWTIQEDQLGRIWLGLSRDGVLIFDPATRSSKYLSCEQNHFCALNVWDIQLDTLSGKVWIATDWEGLWEGDLSTLQFRRVKELSPNILPSDQVLSLAQDKQGFLWISTPLGLCRYGWQDSSCVCYSRESGLPASYLEGLKLDKQGFIWGGTVDKLVRIHPQTLKIDIFDHRFGVDFTAFPLSNIDISSGGKMFAGGKKGFLSWDPDAFVPDTLCPNLYLRAIKILGKPAVEGFHPEKLKNLVLRHFQHALTFEWGVLDFSLPERNRFAWKLAGYEKDWHIGESGSAAVYTQIPPGKYQFQLRNVRNSEAATDEVISENGLNLPVYIQPAFWQRTWFRLLIALLLIGAFIFANRLRISQIKEKEALKANFQKRIIELELSNLRSQMKPHFIFNCLNSINRFIQLSDADTASDYLTKFSRLIRQVLDNSKEETISLDKEIQMLQLYVELEALRFSGRFEYTFHVEEQLDLSGIDIPPLLIQPFIENAIWHGLMHKEGNDGFLAVSFSQKNTFLQVSISDNGIGRAASTSLKQKSASTHISKGMEMTHERLKFIQELYRKKVEVKVYDLMDDKGNPSGTEVRLHIEMG